MTTFESRAIKSRFGKELVVKHKRDDVHLVCPGIDGDGGHLRIFKRADLLWALDATANTDVKHRADAYEDATRAQDDAREWKARAEDAEKDLARTRAELDRTRETYEAELAEAEREERAALEKATAIAAERDRLLATIERIDAVRREFYEVRGDWADPAGAAALKAQMERAILGDPPFELPTEAGARFEATHKGTGTRNEFVTFTDGANAVYVLHEGTYWVAEDVMNGFEDFRLIGADQ